MYFVYSHVFLDLCYSQNVYWLTLTIMIHINNKTKTINLIGTNRQVQVVYGPFFIISTYPYILQLFIIILITYGRKYYNN